MKIKNLYNILLISVWALFLIYSCVRDISVELPRPDDKIVVEAYIELDSFAVVYLNRNYAYFDPVDPEILENNIIWGNEATVVVSNNNNFDTLVPAILDRYPHKAYVGSTIKGQINEEYEIQILFEDNVFSAITTIPDTIGIDSIWYEMWSREDSLGPIGLNWQDPPGLGDFYKLTIRMEGRENSFANPFFTFNVIDDRLEDGQKIMFFPIFKPNQGNDYYEMDIDTSVSAAHNFFYKIGDTVSLKLSTIDKKSFRFWNSIYRSLVTDGNPFANPASVKSNFDDDKVLGHWTGYGAYIETIYIKDSVQVIRL